ncbi:MAG: tryptophan--tRNA ligase [Oscillospiraceae bacterium]|jgi:tryptophanyl-tRNA synthetase|nr:tryptophan--tRNA ligase [Oscillospiraceae bacterium]
MESNQTPKKRVFSAIQPSGMLTLGNYLGALKNWVSLQESYDCIYSVADLHAITARQEPALLRKQVTETFALLLAVGINPEKAAVFVQSHVPAHAELAWVLSCFTQFGELGRMTQFKDKSIRHADNINAGLFSYPCLMAADILLYRADYVPVGEDQRQHLELSRDIAVRVNGLYNDAFTVPDALIPKIGARVMSLQDPQKKMSKSDPNAGAWVALLDKPDDIRRKFRRAVTDSGSEVHVAQGKDGVNNLIGIYAALTGKSVPEIEREFDGRGYGDFKAAVGEAVVEALTPVQERFARLIADKAGLERLMAEGAEAAGKIAGRVLAKVYRKIGLR